MERDENRPIAFSLDNFTTYDHPTSITNSYHATKNNTGFTYIASSPYSDDSTRFYRETVAGSWVSPAFWGDAIRLLRDTGRYEPHQALGHEVKRFWQTQKPYDFGDLMGFYQETGELWQGKPSNPRIDRGKGKPIKYETPKGNGSKPFLPYVPMRIRKRIGRRYGLTPPPMDQSFWEWVRVNNIPIIISEGAKKSFCLLSQGYVAIALYGVNGGYRNEFGVRTLCPELLPFLPGRRVTLAFDSDASATTQQRVTTALFRFGALLQKAGADVAIARWDGAAGKGVDDLIVNNGLGAWETAMKTALSYRYFGIDKRVSHRAGKPDMVVNVPCLSQVNSKQIPDKGIVAIRSPKGSGKTKFQAKLVKNSPVVLSPGHRISLQRAAAARLGLDYRTDCDKTPDGRFIADGARITNRLAGCIQGWKDIPPALFTGCDLVIDEAVQVIRELVSGSLLKGERAAALEWFSTLVLNARRVILADADLDPATIEFIAALRGGERPFILENRYKLPGYNVRFIAATDKTPSINELIQDAGNIPSGQVLMVACDSKRNTQVIQKLLLADYPHLRVLVVNQDTTADPDVAAFIQNPDGELGNYDVVLYSPSLGTGVSIESDRPWKVYGIFSGCSILPSDCLQMLGRVRKPCDRVVWAANTGSNFAGVGYAYTTRAAIAALQDRTNTTTTLIRHQLSAGGAAAVDAIDWGSPHIKLWARHTVDQNLAMLQFRDELQRRLEVEGHTLTLVELGGNRADRAILRAVKQQVLEERAAAIAAAENLTYLQVKLLEGRELSLDQRYAVEKFKIADFYCIPVETLTAELVRQDREGKYRRELSELEGQLYPDTAQGRVTASIESQTEHPTYLSPNDISAAEIRRQLRSRIGIDHFLHADVTWDDGDEHAAAVGDICRGNAQTIKQYLGFNPAEMPNNQIIGELLRRMGLKTKQVHSQRVAGGGRIYTYQIDPESWAAAIAILDRRKARRERIAAEKEAGRPLEKGGSIPSLLGGQPLSQVPPEWQGEALLEVGEWLEWASDPSSGLAESARSLLSAVPPQVIAAARAAISV